MEQTETVNIKPGKKVRIKHKEQCEDSVYSGTVFVIGFMTNIAARVRLVKEICSTVPTTTRINFVNEAEDCFDAPSKTYHKYLMFTSFVSMKHQSNELMSFLRTALWEQPEAKLIMTGKVTNDFAYYARLLG